MFRFLIQFIALLLFFSVARAVIAWVMRLFAATVQRPTEVPPVRNANAPLESAGELHQDPVCGTFVHAATSLQRVVNGRAVYFCSAACRDKYLVAAS